MLTSIIAKLFLSTFTRKVVQTVPGKAGRDVVAHVNAAVPITVASEMARNRVAGRSNQCVNLTMCAAVLHAAEALERVTRMVDSEGKEIRAQEIISNAMMEESPFYYSAFAFGISRWAGSSADEQARLLTNPKLVQWARQSIFSDFVDLQPRIANSEKSRPSKDQRSSGVTGAAKGGRQLHDSGGHAFVVNKCGFYDFFKRHGRPELTTSICMIDKLWMDALSQSKYSRNAWKRPSTLSTGGTRCVFEMAPKKDGQRSILLEDVVPRSSNRTLSETSQTVP